MLMVIRSPPSSTPRSAQRHVPTMHVIITQPYIAPVELLIDDIPYSSTVLGDQYTSFYFVANATGNYTAEIFVNSASKPHSMMVLGV